MGDVFISHVEEDAALARELAAALEAAGYRTWYYERDSLPGPSYLEQVVTAVAQAAAIILLISPDTLPSFQVERELILAYEATTPVVPLLWGLTHAEMRARRPAWAMMLGAATSIVIPPDGVDAILPQLRAGLERLGIAPGVGEDDAATPKPPTQAQRRYRLPAPVAPLIGREREVQRAVSSLRQPDMRLLTLIGPGGVGKTRLALAVAEELQASFRGGAAFVPLASLDDPGLVAHGIATALAVKEVAGQPIAQTLAEGLRDQELLLVLDNLEQLLGAAGLLGDLLAGCPRLKILATSRVVLHVYGEHDLAVPPLALPDPSSGSPSLERLLASEAVRLFVERAKAARTDFVLTEANGAAVVEICRRLDGLPLAIELAAARVRSLPPQPLLRRLESRLALLTGGARDLPKRQQTLRNTVDWSYNLLEPGEQHLFVRLGVFAGGCTLEAAEAICATGDTTPGIDALDGLASLVDKNLLRQRDGTAGEPRYDMLETLREYALERLAESGDEEAVRYAHASYYLDLAERAEPELTGPDQAVWLAWLEEEHDNLRTALTWVRDRGDAVLSLRLAGTLWRFWYTRGYPSEGRGWLEGALALAGSDGNLVALRAKALNGAGVLAERQGEYARAESLYEESLALWQVLGDKEGLAQALNNLGAVASYQGNYARAALLQEESLALRRALGDRRGIALLLGNLGSVAWTQGDLERATALYEESLALRRALGDRWGIASALQNLGLVACERGDYARAAELSAESLALYRDIGDQWGIAALLSNLGAIARHGGDYARAEALGRESLALFERLGDKAAMAECLERLAAVACARGQFVRAARLCGAADTLCEAIGAPLLPADHLVYQHTMEEARDGLGDGFTLAWETGRRMTIEQAVAYALTQGA